MNRVFFSASTLAAILCFSFSVQADSILHDACSLPLNSSNQEHCNDKEVNKSFNYEKSIWETDKEEQFIVITDNTRYAEDVEWQSMGIADKVMNENRNECALSNKGDCIIFDKD